MNAHRKHLAGWTPILLSPIFLVMLLRSSRFPTGTAGELCGQVCETPTGGPSSKSLFVEINNGSASALPMNAQGDALWNASNPLLVLVSVLTPSPRCFVLNTSPFQWLKKPLELWNSRKHKPGSDPSSHAVNIFLLHPERQCFTAGSHRGKPAAPELRHVDLQRPGPTPSYHCCVWPSGLKIPPFCYSHCLF